jgi:hypothetical protein
MATDLNERYDDLFSILKGIDTYNEISSATPQLTNQQQSSLEENSANTLSPESNLAQQKKRYQRQPSNQIKKLLQVSKLISNEIRSGDTTTSMTNFVKDSFSEALNEVKSKIPQILADQMLKELGCTQEQTYDNAVLNNSSGIYIPVESIDLFGLLKEEPKNPTTAFFYESRPIVVQSDPFPMNKELYERTQAGNLSYQTQYGQSYLGKSQQALFDFEYVTQDPVGNTGNFFKISLKNKQDSTLTQSQNLVGQFITDYLKTIQIVDTKTIYIQLFQFLFGHASIQLNAGVNDIRDNGYFSKIVQRILGLCFDSKEEIDVSGIAKVAPLDGIDESFFELTDIDLRQIESEISNIKLGVFEYLDCTTIKQPYNSNEVQTTLSQLFFVDDNNVAENTRILNEAIESVKDKTLGPNFQLGLAIDEDIIDNFVTALYAAVISPKVLLPMMIMVKSLENDQQNIQNSVLNKVYNLESFMKTFKTFNIEVISTIGAEFTKILTEIIKRDLRKLLRSIIRNLRKETQKKRLLQTKSLLSLGILVTQIIPNFRKCKSVVDSIVDLIQLSLRGTRYDTPATALFFAKFRAGFSDTRAMLSVIEELQKKGIPTGPMPDGSPNLWLLSILAQITGVEAERTENGRNQGILPALKVLPIGITMPERFDSVPS